MSPVSGDLSSVNSGEGAPKEKWKEFKNITNFDCKDLGSVYDAVQLRNSLQVKSTSMKKRMTISNEQCMRKVRVERQSLFVSNKAKFFDKGAMMG